MGCGWDSWVLTPVLGVESSGRRQDSWVLFFVLTQFICVEHGVDCTPCLFLVICSILLLSGLPLPPRCGHSPSQQQGRSSTSHGHRAAGRHLGWALPAPFPCVAPGRAPAPRLSQRSPRGQLRLPPDLLRVSSSLALGSPTGADELRLLLVAPWQPGPAGGSLASKSQSRDLGEH